jgi:uncharacterized protein
MIVQDQSEVLAFLRAPDSYRGLVPASMDIEVTQIDTHGAAVFLVGPLAFKMKRAVYFEYMDFSTLERRQQCCTAELVHNRRTSRDIYTGVVAVVRRADGSLAIDGDGEAVEWLVQMRRFDENQVFDRLALRGELEPQLMAETAAVICNFFDNIEVVRETGVCDSIADIVEETARQLAEGVPEVFSGSDTARLTDRQRGTCSDLAAILGQRQSEGYVRLGHGDLHLRNICMFEGKPALFDAIEFNDRLAISDILYDLAFLLMDLLHRGLKSHANLVLNRYLEHIGDDDGLALLPLYLSVRAGIRAFTAIPAAASQSDPVVAARVRAGATEYLELATGFLEPVKPVLVAIGGLSGSGKSTLAQDLASRIAGPAGAVVLRSDVIRKSLFGVPPTERLGPEGYSPEVTAKVYAQMRERADRILSGGTSVILDAVHARPDERAAAGDIATRSDLPFHGFWLAADDTVMSGRIEVRQNDASDANAAILARQLEYDLGEMSWQTVDAGGSPDETLRGVVDRISDAIP